MEALSGIFLIILLDWADIHNIHTAAVCSYNEHIIPGVDNQIMDKRCWKI